MQNEQQLLDYFKQEIARESNAEKEKILAEAQSIKSKALEKIKHDAMVDAKRNMEREINEISLNNQREISKMQKSINRELIAKRQELQNQVFAKANEKLVAFVNSDEYQVFLEKNIALLSDEIYQGQLDIQVNEKDVALMATLMQKTGHQVSVTASADITIGGFIAINKELGMIADYSLDTRLEEQKEWFYNHSGLVIQ